MRIRQFNWDDLPGIAQLMQDYGAALGRTISVNPEQLEKRWRSPYNHPERDAFVAENDDGRLLGYSIADILPGDSFANGVYEVLPDYPDYGRALIRAANQHFIGLNSPKLSLEQLMTMEWHIDDADKTGIRLLEAEGFEEVRQFYTMRIELNQALEAGQFPEGFRLVPFSLDMLETVFENKSEIFQDHWGEQNDDLSEWQADCNQAGFDPGFWFLLYHEDTLAAMVLSQPTGEKSAWIGIVGVHRQYRKLGLAQALLKHCFHEYQSRGYQILHLGVDSQSPTNAVALYERVGMTVRQKQRFYRKSCLPFGSLE